MPLQPVERAPVLASLAARYGDPHELTPRYDTARAGAGPTGAAPVQFVIDISEHQDVIDWHAVAATPQIPGVIIKALEGTTYHDPKYAANLAGAQRAGIRTVGAYHFLTATSSAVTQADAFCQIAPPDTIHALDVEAPGPLDVHGWVDRYRQHFPTHPLLIYTGKFLWTQRSHVTYTGGDLGHLWNAGAVPGGYVPGVDETPARAYARLGGQNGGLPYQGWTDWTLLQFSESCRVPGIPTRVDANAYRGTLDQLHALTGQPPAGDEMTPDDWTKLQTMLDANATDSARDVHNQQLYRATWTDGGGTVRPLTVADALLTAARRQIPSAADIAAAVKAELATIPTTAGGTAATLDDATIATIANAVTDEFNKRLVRR